MPGMMYLAAVTVKRGCIQALACTPSLAAALERRRVLRFTGRQLQRLPVDRVHERWRVVRV